jgi:hypothetical protein
MEAELEEMRRIDMLNQLAAQVTFPPYSTSWYI